MFLEEQYDEPKRMMIKSVNCISGSVEKAEATACGQYVERMWPTVGPAVLNAVSRATDEGMGVHSGKPLLSTTTYMIVHLI